MSQKLPVEMMMQVLLFFLFSLPHLFFLLCLLLFLICHFSESLRIDFDICIN